MSMTIDELEAEVLKLPTDLRVKLAEVILASVDDEVGGIDRESLDEAKRRSEELRASAVQAESAEGFSAALRLASEYTWQEGHIASHPGILHGQPIIAGSRVPVRSVAEMWRMGTAPEEIQQQLPHLTMAQVFAALSYFADHQDEIIAAIERNRLPADQLRRAVGV